MPRKATTKIITDPQKLARAAKLRYVNAEEPGITRQPQGDGFAYYDSGGKLIKDKSVLERIHALAIPPAYTEVWICPDADGHIQATGRDARGRKQYRYHARWREARSETKFTRMLLFGEALPRIRARIERDMALPGLPREKVLAAVVALMGSTFIRVGNMEYARHNDSYGLTTMQDEHVKVRGAKIHFEFRGKSGKDHTIDLSDKRLAQIVKRCRDVPGQNLFQFYDEGGTCHGITSSDVNAYMREISGEDFTAKDFRTWGGTVLAISALAEQAAFESDSERRQNIVQMYRLVAERLGNTVAVCRKYYVHPAIIDAYENGTLLATMEQFANGNRADNSVHPLQPAEQAVMAILRAVEAG